MRTLFKIPAEKETRLWNKYMSNTYEQLNKPDSTVQDAGLFHGQVKWDSFFVLVTCFLIPTWDIYLGVGAGGEGWWVCSSQTLSGFPLRFL